MADLHDIDPRGAGQKQSGVRWLAGLAKRQHGAVARRQLRKLGFTRHEIDGLVARGHLHVLHRGVYAVGHTRLTVRGRWMAAVLACGPDAVLSHRSAAALWDLRPIPDDPIDVSVPARPRRSRSGIRVHNVRTLHEDDRGELDGIPVTGVHRTLLDYADVARPQQLRHAVEAGLRRELLDHRAFEALLGRSRGRRGATPLRSVLDEIRGPAPWTDSELERAFLSLVRDAGLPEPSANVLVEEQRVDCCWRRASLIVEVDGYAFHKSRAKFEADRKRDAKLVLAGYRVLRVTHRRIEFESEELVRELRQLLSEPGGAVEAAGR
jgi:very-short-patch-repair endonuclease